MADRVTWVPPRKPEPLLQELYWPDAWAILVCCMLLNRTGRKQVDSVVATFFERYPNPRALLEGADAEVAETLKSLGFKNRRTKALKQFSSDFLTKEWTDPRDLYGIGEYAARCYEMLVRGVFGDAAPDDHALADYWYWFHSQQREENDANTVSR